MKQMPPQELKARMDSGQKLAILDVREVLETEICRLPEAVNIPMNEVQARLGELDPGREWVVYCHHGVRSAAVVRFLQKQGFQQVSNLAGGIARWALAVDPTLPQY
jgi:rhodanese-related sulfurtransferase